MSGDTYFQSGRKTLVPLVTFHSNLQPSWHPPLLWKVRLVKSSETEADSLTLQVHSTIVYLCVTPKGGSPVHLDLRRGAVRDLPYLKGLEMKTAYKIIKLPFSEKSGKVKADSWSSGVGLLAPCLSAVMSPTNECNLSTVTSERHSPNQDTK